MDKKEIAGILETILDGLTKGESSEKKTEEIKKFYIDELNKVNNENQFYERVIRFCLLERYVYLKESPLNSFGPINGSKLFSRQNAGYNAQVMSEFDWNDFDRFVDEYLTAARNSTLIGIEKEK